MKRMILLPVILGLTLSLTGCRANDAESSIQQSATSVTTSETALNVSTSDISDSSQMQETELQHSEPVMTETLDTLINAAPTEIEATVPSPAPTAKSDEIAESDAVPPQLETVPKDVDIEEDTGDFGELFS